MDCRDTRFVQRFVEMARQVRIEYAGASYHVMARGNHGSPVYDDDRDRKMWLATPAASYAYDNNGNRLSMTSGSTGFAYTWDADDRLVAINNGTTSTDGFGRRKRVVNGSVLTIYNLGNPERVVRRDSEGGGIAPIRRGISVESPRQNFKAPFRSGICDTKPHPESIVARANATRHTPFSLVSTTVGTNAFADAAPGRGLKLDSALGFYIYSAPLELRPFTPSSVLSSVALAKVDASAEEGPCAPS
jgi:YD repeat-containing protein